MTKSAYFIGIKGVGMTSLALAMQDAGWSVSGSDTDESFITDNILRNRNLGVRPLSTKIPEGTDLIVYSAAYSVPIGARHASPAVTMPLAQALSGFVKDKRVIAVAGVGGKTTTSAMLAALFHAGSRDVGYYVGTGSISGLEAPGHSGTDPYFVVEADEYAINKTDKRPKFALLSPRILITTNIIHDHPDIYPDEDATLKVFTDLINRISADGTWICNPADPLTARILNLQGQTLKGIKVIQYGSDHPLYTQLQLSVFGEQNRLDGLAAVLAAMEAGVTEPEALSAIKAYQGAGRRQECHGEIQGRLLYDDYGHHPREIELTIRSFKQHFPDRRLVLVFESHTYSRTQALLTEFVRAISLADLAFIMPIFESAREKNQPHSINADSLATLIPGATALTWDNAAQTVWSSTRPGDLVLTMGAGFVYKLHEQFLRQTL